MSATREEVTAGVADENDYRSVISIRHDERDSERSLHTSPYRCIATYVARADAAGAGW